MPTGVIERYTNNYIFYMATMKLDEIKQQLGVLGDHVIGITPECYDPEITYERQVEVELYLKRNKQKNTHWFVIDDTADYFKPGAPVLLVDGKLGFTKIDCLRLHKLISKIDNKYFN